MSIEKTPSKRRLTRFQSSRGLRWVLDASDCEKAMKQISTYCSDPELVRWALLQFRQVLKRQMTYEGGGRGSCWSMEEINETIDNLNALLDCSKKPSSAAVAEVHSCIGLLQMEREHHSYAVHSLLKALWIYSAATTSLSSSLSQSSWDDEGQQIATIAITTHRLGLAYGYNGDYPHAIRLLKKAVSDYEKAGIRDDNPCMQDVKESLQGFQESEMSRSWRRSRAKTTTASRSLTSLGVSNSTLSTARSSTSTIPEQGTGFWNSISNF